MHISQLLLDSIPPIRLNYITISLATSSHSSAAPSSVSIRSCAKANNQSSTMSLRVAVIGAGAAGLAAARELRSEGHVPVVFERAGEVGGTWIYDDAAGEEAANSTSLYASLRTNLPREVMGFLDFPFAAVPDSVDPRRFPAHQEVLRYIQDYARRFELHQHLRLRTQVLSVTRRHSSCWSVRWRMEETHEDEEEEETFDAVVVCNGHYTEPRIADDIPGLKDAWPGKQMHSHSYRVPDPFVGQVVVIIGAKNSGGDISRDIAAVAKEVHMVDRAAPANTCRSPSRLSKPLAPIHAHQIERQVERAEEDGSVVFRDGTSVKADIIMHCTGYKYSFPFLGDDSTITIHDNRIHPLYKHVFPPQVSPSSDCRSRQFEYDDWLAEQSGHAKVEEWRKQMYDQVGLKKKDCPETYRDEWDDHDLLEQANQDFQKYL
ncbi:hypothetical protein EJB05_08345, partial [Eragrostis curvula]